MFLRHKKSILPFVFFLFFLLPSSAYAGLDLITVSTNPATPGPNQAVTISVESYSVPVNSSKIIWYVDGKPIKEGVAEKSLLTKTKNFGEKVVVDIVILTPDGNRFDKSITLRPEEVDMLWEANTYTPPFYKGKALPTYKSTVKVTAIPRFDSASSNPEEYYYKWTVNRAQGAGEGLGRNSTLVMSGWSGAQFPVNVQVTKPETDLKGSAMVSIGVVDPVVRFYEQGPLLGVNFKQVLPGSITTTANTFKIRAIPYFFSTENYGTDDMLYTWLNGNVAVPGALNPNTLTLSSMGREGGATLVRLTVQNRKRILQEAETRVIVNFNTK